MADLRVAYLGLNVTDVGEWRHFATNVLGMMETTKVTGADADNAYFRMDDRSYRISVHKAEVSTLRHFGLECANEREMSALVRRLEDAEVNVEELDAEVAKTRGVGGAVAFDDPAGNRVELAHTPVFDHSPFCSPAGVSGFVTGDMGLGHLVLLAAPYGETRDFYNDVLGFRGSDMMNLNGVRIDFLHCNPRHHSLALADAFGMNAVAHFMVEARTIDDVGYALDRFRDNNIEVPMGLGRHGNDMMLSFYGKTPSGFDVEFGYGGIRVDDATWRTAEIPTVSMWGHRPEPVGVQAVSPL